MTDSTIDKLHEILVREAKIDQESVQKWMQKYNIEDNMTKNVSYLDIKTKLPNCRATTEQTCSSWVREQIITFKGSLAIPLCNRTYIMSDIFWNLNPKQVDHTLKSLLQDEVIKHVGKSTLIVYSLVWDQILEFEPGNPLIKLQDEVKEHILNEVGCAYVESSGEVPDWVQIFLPKPPKKNDIAISSSEVTISPISTVTATYPIKSSNIPTENKAQSLVGNEYDGEDAGAAIAAFPDITQNNILFPKEKNQAAISLSPDTIDVDSSEEESSPELQIVDQNRHTGFEASANSTPDIEIVAARPPLIMEIEPPTIIGDTRGKRRREVMTAENRIGDSESSEKKKHDTGKEIDDKPTTAESADQQPVPQKDSTTLAPASVSSESVSKTTSSHTTSKSKKKNHSVSANEKRKKIVVPIADDGNSDEPAPKKAKTATTNSKKHSTSSDEDSDHSSDKDSDHYQPSSEMEKKKSRSRKIKSKRTSRKNQKKVAETDSGKDESDDDKSEADESANEKHSKETKTTTAASSSSTNKKSDRSKRNETDAFSSKTEEIQENDGSEEIKFLCLRHKDPLPKGVQSLKYNLPFSKQLRKDVKYITATYMPEANLIHVEPNSFESKIKSGYKDDHYVYTERQLPKHTNNAMVNASNDFHVALKAYEKAKKEKLDKESIDHLGHNVQLLGKKWDRIKKDYIMSKNVKEEHSIHKTVAEHAIRKCIALNELNQNVAVDYDTSGQPEHKCNTEYILDEETDTVINLSTYERNNKIKSTKTDRRDDNRNSLPKTKNRERRGDEQKEKRKRDEEVGSDASDDVDASSINALESKEENGEKSRERGSDTSNSDKEDKKISKRKSNSSKNKNKDKYSSSKKHTSSTTSKSQSSKSKASSSKSGTGSSAVKDKSAKRKAQDEDVDQLSDTENPSAKRTKNPQNKQTRLGDITSELVTSVTTNLPVDEATAADSAPVRNSENDIVSGKIHVFETVVLGPGKQYLMYTTHEHQNTLFFRYSGDIRLEYRKDHIDNGRAYLFTNYSDRDQTFTIEKHDTPPDTGSASTTVATNN